MVIIIQREKQTDGMDILSCPGQAVLVLLVIVCVYVCHAF